MKKEEQYITELIEEVYGIIPERVIPILSGVGGETYKIKCKDNDYIFKIISDDPMSHPEKEADLCFFLQKEGVPVPIYIDTKNGEKVTFIDNHKKAHLQSFLEGKTYKVNTASDAILNQSAEKLALIHKVLSHYEALPIGIGKDFFTYMTPQRALVSYEESLEIAKKMKKKEIVSDLEFRIHLVKNFPDMHFDLDKLTCKNTHGDFTINQLICSDTEILGIVDWTAACIHPVVWEIVRSYAYAAPECREGKMNLERLHRYVDRYKEISSLTDYDEENLLRVYFYQIAVCDYYKQYLFADKKDREEFLWQARFATGLLHFLSEYV